jgi:hypothetical protein
MPSTFTRIRRKVTPIPKGGQLKMGYYNPAVTSGGQFLRWHEAQLSPQYYTFAAPYSIAQLTMDNIHGGPPYITGGAFRTLKIEYCVPYYGVFGKGSYERNDKAFRYVGGFGPPSHEQFKSDPAVGDLSVALTVGSSFFPDMTGMGDKGFARAKPELEKASGFVFSAEIRDAPRMLKQTSKAFKETWEAMGGSKTSARMAPKKVADDFLNYQFGWKPFIGDLKKFDFVINNSHQINSKITRDNGRAVRRRVSLGNDRKERLIDSGTGVALSPGLVNDYFNGTPKWEVWEVEETTTSAVGRFKYYRPEFDANRPDYLSAWNVAMRQMTMYGFRPSPSNIYKAIPWTWAADWVTNFGDHIDHLSDIAVDSLACDYFYVMHSKQMKRIFRQELPFITGMKVLEFTRLISSKQRQEGAGPYGFSLSWDNLSPRQFAIAGALGIKRI